MLKNDQWFLVKELLMVVVGFLLWRSWFGFSPGKGKPENKDGEGLVIPNFFFFNFL